MALPLVSLMLLLSVLVCVSSKQQQHQQHEHQHQQHEHQHHASVPILSISLNVDRKGYLARLLRSIDYPVDRVLIQIGNTNSSVRSELRRTIDQAISSTNSPSSSSSSSSPLPLVHQGNVEVSELDHNPGSARGFNNGLRALLEASATTATTTTTGGASNSNSNGAAAASSAGPSWCLVVNSDIAFYPGFTSLVSESSWSAVAFTKRLVQQVGLFDENFYPAYFEDDDYGIRIHLAGFHAARFNNTPLLHGEIDGSKDYLSGIFSNLYLSRDAHLDAWRKQQNKGVKLSHDYLQRKWGVKVGSFNERGSFVKAKGQATPLDCKSYDALKGPPSSLAFAMSYSSSSSSSAAAAAAATTTTTTTIKAQNCKPTFTHPFNDASRNASYWRIDDEQALNKLQREEE